MKNRIYNPKTTLDNMQIVDILQCYNHCVHYNKCSRAYSKSIYPQWYCGCFKNKHGIKK